MHHFSKNVRLNYTAKIVFQKSSEKKTLINFQKVSKPSREKKTNSNSDKVEVLQSFDFNKKI